MEPSHPKMGILVREAAAGRLPAKLKLGLGEEEQARPLVAEYSSLALLLPLSTFVGYLIGYWLDKAFGTTWLSIVVSDPGQRRGFCATHPPDHAGYGQ